MGVPSEIPAELHDAWQMWFSHYRKDGSTPRRAAEEATASVRAHYLDASGAPSFEPMARESRRGVGVYSAERWQPLCRHCGAVAHGELTCAQASAGSLIGLDRTGRAA